MLLYKIIFTNVEQLVECNELLITRLHIKWHKSINYYYLTNQYSDTIATVFKFNVFGFPTKWGQRIETKMYRSYGNVLSYSLRLSLRFLLFLLLLFLQFFQGLLRQWFSVRTAKIDSKTFIHFIKIVQISIARSKPAFDLPKLFVSLPVWHSILIVTWHRRNKP